MNAAFTKNFRSPLRIISLKVRVGRCMDRYGVSRNFNILVTIKFRLDIILLKKKNHFRYEHLIIQLFKMIIVSINNQKNQNQNSQY